MHDPDNLDTGDGADSSMGRPAETLEELILERIRVMEPDPFYPRSFTMLSQNPEGHVLRVLDSLHRQGLITRVREEGQGKELAVRLTPKAKAMFADPVSFDKWRSQRVHSDRLNRRLLGLMENPGGGWATQILVGLVVANFAWGAWLAWQAGFLGEYLSEPKGEEISALYLKLGAVNPESLSQGQWWRLLTSGFVHFGSLHILSNCIGFLVLGKLIERLIGSSATLVVFLVGTIWGAGLALTFQPALLAGASGGIFGLLGGIIVWYLLNAKNLDRLISRSVRNWLLFICLMNLGISLVPGVSGLAHLGGAIGGALATVGFLLSGFDRLPGNTKKLMAGTLCLLLSAVGGVGLVESATRASGQHAEVVAYNQDVDFLNKRLFPEWVAVNSEYNRLVLNQAEPLQLKDKFRRNREAAALAVVGLRNLNPAQSKVHADWKGARLSSKGMRAIADKIIDLLAKRMKYVQLLEECLRQGREWPMERDPEVREARKACRAAKQAFLNKRRELEGPRADPSPLDDIFEDEG